MPAMTRINFEPDGIVQAPVYLRVEQLPPMQYHEDSWYLIQDAGYNYLCEPDFNSKYSDEKVVNKMYTDFHRIPGDIALKVVAKTFGIPIETREVARALYEASLQVRIRE